MTAARHDPCVRERTEQRGVSGSTAVGARGAAHVKKGTRTARERERLLPNPVTSQRPDQWHPASRRMGEWTCFQVARASSIWSAVTKVCIHVFVGMLKSGGSIAHGAIIALESQFLSKSLGEGQLVYSSGVGGGKKSGFPGIRFYFALILNNG